MLSRFSFLIILFLITSCGLLQKKPSLKEKDYKELLNAIQLEGEGRGRLSIDQHQYLFSFESALQENNDWILAASIPLHGEEAMILVNLKEAKVSQSTPDSLEIRIRQEIAGYLRSKPKLPKELSKKFIPDLRKLVRFVMAEKMGLSKKCEGSGVQISCTLDGEKFEILTEDKHLRIKKIISQDYFLELSGENLTGPIFSKTNFILHSQNAGVKDSPILLFELFWK